MQVRTNALVTISSSPRPQWRALLGLALLWLLLPSLGCATAKIYRVDREIRPAGGPVAHHEKFSIAVLPFEYQAKKNWSEAERALKQFERHYFASRLVDALRRSAWVAEAYFAEEETPAVDYIVRGRINRADGEVTEVRLFVTGIDGTELLEKGFGVDLSSGDFRKLGPDPGARVWNRPVNVISEHLARVTSEQRDALESARRLAYLRGDEALPGRGVTVGPMVAEAARLERRELLGPVTDATLGQAEAIRSAYAQWQARATELGEKRRQKKVEASFFVVVGLASIALAIAGGHEGSISSGEAGLLGATGALATLQALRASEQASLIDGAVEDFRGRFGAGVRPKSVKLMDAVHRLSGSVSTQIAQLREIVHGRLVRGEILYAANGT